MLSDQAIIDNINPFVVRPHMSLPGTWSNPYDFAKVSGIQVSHMDKEDFEKSPICSYGITAGDKTIDFCSDLEPNCPMSRMLEPKRNIDYGFTRMKSSNNIEKEKEKITILSKQSTFDIVPILLVVVIVVLLLLNRK